MTIDRAAVDHVARLARLALSEEERESMRTEMTKILAHAEKIQELDLDDVEPTAHSVPLRNVMRPDEVKPGLNAGASPGERPRGRGRTLQGSEDRGGLG